MTAYIFKSSLSLILLFGLYWFLLRREKLFVFNRIFLIASIVFSLLVPFLSIPVNIQTSSKLESIIPVYNYLTPEIISEGNTPSILNNTELSDQKGTPFFNIPLFLLIVYISGVLLFLARFLRNLLLVTQRSRSTEKINFKGCKILLTKEPIGPCCFFKYIFLNKADYIDGRIDKDLLDHEIEHARQSHTVDIILIELVKIFYWFNPTYLLYEKAIRINHEYLADNGVIRYNSDIKSYADKLLSFINCSSNMSLTSGSNNSFTKMRLIMMLKSKSGILKQGTRIAITLFLVTIFFIVLSFKESKYQSSATSLSQIEIQQKTVKGVVLTEDGKPLIDATVTISGKNNVSLKSLTFPDGRFTLNNVEPGASLNIECRGFKTQTLKSDFTSVMTIKMVRDPDYKGKVITTEIKTVNFRNSDFTPATGFIVINGEILQKNEEFRLSPGDIKSIGILNEKDATNKYGDKAKDGVLEIALFGNNRFRNSNADSLKYTTLWSINHSSNKGELIDIPITKLQYVSVWTYHDLDKSSKKELRTISIMTRDYYKVIGTVSGENEKPLAGVKISASEKSSAVTSDKDGNFRIEDVKDGSLLEFSLQGYQTYYLSTQYGVAFNEPLSIVLKKNGSTEKEDVYETAEKMPQYLGGDMELLKFVAENTRYPENAKKDNAQGRVVIRFIINTHGRVEDPIVLTSVHPDLDKEALRVVSQLKGFIPGTKDGKPISVYYNLPITFGLPNASVAK